MGPDLLTLIVSNLRVSLTVSVPTPYPAPTGIPGIVLMKPKTGGDHLLSLHLGLAAPAELAI
jgi:hypothetical protein